MTTRAPQQVGGSARCARGGASIRSCGVTRPKEESWRQQEAPIEPPDGEPSRTFETIVIGGGQAGLSVGYYLKKRGRLVRDPGRERADRRLLANPHVGLASPVHSCALRQPPGLAVSGPRLVVPDRARDCRLPRGLRGAVRASREARDDRRPSDRRSATATSWSAARCGSTADRVVVATGFYGKPSVPEFASELDPRIVQMHSSDYRDPSQLRPGGVLLVGAGQLRSRHRDGDVETHQTWLSGPDKGQVPFRIESPLQAPRPAGALVRRLARAHRKDAARTQGAAARPHGRRAAHPGQVERSPQPASSGTEDGRRAGRFAGARGRTRHGRRERHLVHGFPAGLQLDRRAGLRGEAARCTSAASRPSQASTSSAWTSSTRSRRRTSAASGATRGASPSTSRRASGFSVRRRRSHRRRRPG